MEKNDVPYEDFLAQQLAMNRQTWALLQKYGVTEDRQLRLDFSFAAPGRESAAKLSALLQKQTNYEVQVESTGSFLRRKWRVEGRTRKTAVSFP